MIIAVMSDLHDNVVAWRSIVKYLNNEQILFLINCGDTCAPAMLKEMAATYHGHIDTVFGNVADRDLESQVVKTLTNVTHHGDRGTVTLEGRKIFFDHFPELAEETALSGDVNLACHGHTHIKRWEPSTTPRATRRVPGKPSRHPVTMILNPGTAGGMFQYPSFATVDLTAMTCQFHEVTV